MESVEVVSQKVKCNNIFFDFSCFFMIFRNLAKKFASKKIFHVKIVFFSIFPISTIFINLVQKFPAKINVLPKLSDLLSLHIRSVLLELRSPVYYKKETRLHNSTAYVLQNISLK